MLGSPGRSRLASYDPNRGAPDGCILIIGILGYALFGVLLIGAGLYVVGRLVFG